jgi:hypothetical protein
LKICQFHFYFCCIHLSWSEFFLSQGSVTLSLVLFYNLFYHFIWMFSDVYLLCQPWVWPIQLRNWLEGVSFLVVLLGWFEKLRNSESQTLRARLERRSKFRRSPGIPSPAVFLAWSTYLCNYFPPFRLIYRDWSLSLACGIC